MIIIYLWSKNKLVDLFIKYLIFFNIFKLALLALNRKYGYNLTVTEKHLMFALLIITDR